MVKGELEAFHFQYEDGYCHVGSFIGTPEAKATWLQPQIQQWILGIQQLAQVAPQFPQMAHAGLSKSLQHEWQYLQRVIPDVGPTLAPIEAALTETFLPALLVATDEETKCLCELTTLPIHHVGMGIPNPENSTSTCYGSSQQLMDLLMQSLAAGTELRVRVYAVSCVQSLKMQQFQKNY